MSGYPPRFTIERTPEHNLVLYEHGVRYGVYPTRQALADDVYLRESEAHSLRGAYDRLLAADLDAMNRP